MALGIHIRVRHGDIMGVKALLARSPSPKALVNTVDEAGWTPLMHAVASAEAEVGLVRLLLDADAKVHATSRGELARGCSVLCIALGAGDPEKVRLLLDRGADLGYRRRAGYDALIDAVHGRDIARDPRLMDLMRLIVARGAPLNGRSKYCESGVRVTSNQGRFDAVAFLLAAGAPADDLRWSPLMFALATGTLDDVEARVATGDALEARDSWERTPWLLAIQTGDIAKASLLLAHGADRGAVGRCDKPPLFYAIGNGHVPMLRWLLELGLDPEQGDKFGVSPLMEAAAQGEIACLDALLARGVSLNREQYGETALGRSASREIALRLLEAGADPAKLGVETHRLLLGLAPETTDEHRRVAPEDFLRARHRRFGRSNPQEMSEPFWVAMVRSGASAWEASAAFAGAVPAPSEPVWSARRFGQSITLLPDGRIIEIAGEHEDHYDPDFCIYNDVIVHDGRGGTRIYGYPQETFPPTDFHTATLVGENILIIGSLGYRGARHYGETPVYRLSLSSFGIEHLATTGPAPGWLHGHRARLVDDHTIRVSGGHVLVQHDGEERMSEHFRHHALDLATLRWSEVDAPAEG